jgi:AGCS family alanine or glycine:cation symporter
LFGEDKKYITVFHILYLLVIIIGAELDVRSVINIVDAMMIFTSVPNIIALYILAPEIKQQLIQYCNKYQIKNPL